MAVLGVVVSPADAVAIRSAYLFDAFGVISQGFLGLEMFRADVPSRVGVPGQPQTHKRIIEAPVNGPEAIPVLRDVKGPNYMGVSAKQLVYTSLKLAIFTCK